ncbi:WXG100 family type VII secretion target [Streptomyces sp. SID14478]|uniref:WXG100 family type VII secretion target n=1 Tax=Streptomyces sp. SID14478 TaxID=2706073 RepID=UPI0013D9F2D8|nr:WXG100 family type VII secretion target [Streptomyces sp. SID14478]NEB75065.1 WXG100 family type VII secretion target [Streptomyces sp. SID14478]
MGTNNADGLAVKYDALDMAATTIGNEAKALEQDLAELRQLVVRSQEYWEGDAQAGFHGKLQKWDKEAGEIHTALTGIGHVVHTSGGDYMAGDKKAASYFQ